MKEGVAQLSEAEHRWIVRLKHAHKWARVWKRAAKTLKFELDWASCEDCEAPADAGNPCYTEGHPWTSFYCQRCVNKRAKAYTRLRSAAEKARDLAWLCRGAVAYRPPAELICATLSEQLERLATTLDEALEGKP